MADGPKVDHIVYVGSDDNYFSEIKKRYLDTYSQKNFEFLIISDQNDYSKIFVQMLGIENLTIGYLDFSLMPDQVTRLARLLKRESSFNSTVFVGLVDKEKQLIQANAIGISFSHVKCGEMSDVVYDPCYIAYAKSVKKPTYANAKFAREAEMFEHFRVSYITPEYIHVEGNMKLNKGEVIEVTSKIPQKILPSIKYIVRNSYTTDLYYDYRYSYDLDYVYVDKPELEEIDGDPKVTEMVNKEKVDEYNQNLKHTKKKLITWVADNIGGSLPKKTKIMLIDQQMLFFDENAKPFETYPYNIRCQTELEDLEILDVVKPHLIGFQYFEEEIEDDDDDDDDETVATVKPKKEEKDITKKNSIEQLTLLVKKIKTMESYNPFILVFNTTKFSSQSLQDSFQYKMILAHASPMELSQIVDFAHLYESRQEKKLEKAIQTKVLQLRKQDPKKYGRLTNSDFAEKKYYPKRTLPISHAKCSYDIILQSMTESECTFLAEEEFIGVQFSLKFPVNLKMSLVQDDGKLFVSQSKKNLYHALFHSIGEDEKKKIRQFVNEIFFTDLNNKRTKEKEEHEKRNKEAKEKKGNENENNDSLEEEDKSEVVDSTKTD